ncbi:LysR family transcriptional regulator [Novosphingobium album (ex Liu et al. 2023)]|uniref:LysR family transcriptional regulator n=1 Tax=Novosphingobium album (ex Liu et al. 2023) TaxID=3031130 RepID=A0ABT5WU73_9SPHN|nr:LysR family transcriptional regulator [Novosphingobium album (ex Liu et al. 2023)]MDE8653450.1 LysR family transcriptional regulator [Novosphingobium album (ex Liu et al. 2023)]
MDRIDLYRIFVRVAECASFTRAADLLGMPRSSVSAAIQELEGRLGARLLHRTTRSVTLTQDGRLFHERCLRLVAEVEEAEDLFRQTHAGPQGKLSIDVPGRLGRLVIAPALPAFLDRYPGIEIRLGMTDRAIDLIGDSVDCVLRVGVQPDSGMIARPVGSLRFINVASPAYLARHGTPRSPRDLAAHQAVHFASASTGRVEAWEWVEQGEVHAIELAGRVTVNSAEAQIACCLAGLGLIQIPAFDVKAHLRAGELVEVMPDHPAEPMPMALLYPHRQFMTRRLRILVDWLADLMAREVLG